MICVENKISQLMGRTKLRIVDYSSCHLPDGKRPLKYLNKTREKPQDGGSAIRELHAGSQTEPPTGPWMGTVREARSRTVLRATTPTGGSVGPLQDSPLMQ